MSTKILNNIVIVKRKCTSEQFGNKWIQYCAIQYYILWYNTKQYLFAFSSENAGEDEEDNEHIPLHQSTSINAGEEIDQSVSCPFNPDPVKNTEPSLIHETVLA